MKKFQYWRLDGKGRIHGMLPLEDGESPSYYVEIDFDLGGRPREVREWVEGHAQPLVRKPTFEGNRLHHSDYADPIRGRNGKNCYEYDTRGLLCRRYELDPKGKKRFEVEIRCDGEGRFVEEKLFDHRGRLKDRRVYGHDPSGREVEEKVYGGKQGETLEGFFTMSHDPRGNIVRRTWHDPAGRVKRAFVYGYDDRDRRIRMGIEEEGTVVSSVEKVLDESGKTKAREYRDAAGDTLASEDQQVLAGKKKLAEVLKIRPEQIQALRVVAYAHLERGRFVQARALFEALATLDPENTYDLAGAGASALGQQEPATAIAWYDRALARDPKHAGSLAGKGEALLLLGEIERALETFRELLMQQPSPRDPLVRRVQAILQAVSQSAAPPSRPGP